MAYAIACYNTGDHGEAIAVNDRLLEGGLLIAQVIKNRQFSLDVLFPR
jgi:hypothetical protein